MKEEQVLACPLAEAQRRAAVQGDAPFVAAALRQQGAAAVCIVGAGMDWLDTPHARGWLQGAPLDRASLDAALSRGFVAADAVVVAKMAEPHALPWLSWGEQPPQAPRLAAPGRRLDLYAIVDSAGRLRQVLDAGVRTVQLRIKTPAVPDAAWQAMLREEVAQAVADSKRAGAELFVNDHWRLARELGAYGVHLGQEDLLALGDAGRHELQASGLALGISSHSLWELARARTLSPRYIACGPVWPTLTKDMPWLPQGLDNLAWWCRAAGVPVTAIGGILQAAEVQAAASAGPDGVCIVRGLGADPRKTLPAFKAALAAGRAQPFLETPAWPHPELVHPPLMRQFTPRLRWSLAAFCVAVVVLLALQVRGHGPMLEFDQDTSLYFALHRNPWVTTVMSALSAMHQTLCVLVATALIALGLGLRKHWDSMRALLAVPVGMLGNVGLKDSFQRARPHWDDPLVQLASYSFPSGHALAVTVFYAMLCAVVFSAHALAQVALARRHRHRGDGAAGVLQPRLPRRALPERRDRRGGGGHVLGAGVPQLAAAVIAAAAYGTSRATVACSPGEGTRRSRK